MFLKDSWYVAAWSHEIDDGKLLGRTILGEPVLLYRGEAGHVVAMHDRCCHRGAPLSMGRREGDAVRCLYHGLKFSPSGQCVEIPGQDRIPPKACVRVFKVVERSSWIWIWMGDPARADESLIPDITPGAGLFRARRPIVPRRGVSSLAERRAIPGIIRGS